MKEIIEFKEVASAKEWYEEMIKNPNCRGLQSGSMSAIYSGLEDGSVYRISNPSIYNSSHSVIEFDSDPHKNQIPTWLTDLEDGFRSFYILTPKTVE